MKLRRVSLLAAMVLTSAGIAPVAAAAEPVSVASCGTGAGMWTGSYEGSLVFDSSPNDPHPYHPSGAPAIQNGNLVWTAFYDTYTTNSVTCSGSKVTTFGGEVPFEVKWIGPFAAVDPMNESDKTFSLTRTS